MFITLLGGPLVIGIFESSDVLPYSPCSMTSDASEWGNVDEDISGGIPGYILALSPGNNDGGIGSKGGGVLGMERVVLPFDLKLWPLLLWLSIKGFVDESSFPFECTSVDTLSCKDEDTFVFSRYLESG